MPLTLPLYLEPLRFADHGKRFRGSAAPTEFQRLAEAVVRIEGEVRYELHFCRDERRRARIEGWVSADVVACCQRCLQELPLHLSSTLSLVAVESVGECEGLPDEVDPLLLEGPRRRSVELLEDELLLEMPQFPRHSDASCVGTLPGLSEAEAEVHPFAGLAALKRE